MDLDHTACYRALEARDRRFDGRLFVAVKTTGIYCRPICPARTPKSVNVLFFATAAAAGEAGFRPCLRCRPEVSPELATWHGTSNTVSRALRLIEAGALHDDDLEALATRLGVGSRHLRRLFAHHLGASPIAVLQTRRVHLAKQLIHETELPMIEVALAAGFGSVRRFNETFKALFGRPPSSLRRRRQQGDAVAAREAITLRLPYSPPYAWTQVLDTLARNCLPGIETVQRETYVRSFAIDGTPGLVSVRHTLQTQLEITVHCADIKLLQGIITRVRRVFDLGADPAAIDALLIKDTLLAPRVAARPGLRAVGAWDGVELCLRTVLQRLAPAELARDFALRFGTPLPQRLAAIHAGITHAFPTPAQLIAVEPATAAELECSRVLRALACFLTEHADVLNRSNDVQQLAEHLELAEVPRTIAQFIAIAQLHPSDACDPDDPQLLSGLESALQREHWLQRAERWRPWRAYAAAHLRMAAPVIAAARPGLVHAAAAQALGHGGASRAVGVR